MSIVCVAFALRLCVVLLVFRDVASPAEQHQQFGWEMGWVARSVASSKGFSSPFAPSTGPTALVPPLYPYLLAGIFRIFGIYSAASAFVVLGLNSIFSALTCVPIFFLARNSYGPRTALVAGWVWAVYPLSIYFSATRVWDYSLTALLFATCWWIAHNLHLRPTFWRSAGFGLLCGLTALCNPSVVALYPILLATIIWKAPKTDRRWILSACLIVVSALLVVSPWTARNLRVLHAPIPLRDGFWLECWAGNHGDQSNSNPSNAHPASNDAEMGRYESMGEVAYLFEKHNLAVAYITQHPIETVLVTGRRIIRFWTGFWSFRRAYTQVEIFDVPNFFFCSCIIFFMLRGLRRSWKSSRSAALPSLLLLLVFPIPYYLTHSSMDYRQPIEPEIILLVAIGLTTRETRIKIGKDGLGMSKPFVVSRD